MDNTGAVPYPLALVITLGVEVPIYVAVLSFARLLRGARAVAAAVGVNVLTHPVVWVVLTAHPGWFVPVEVGVCLVEAVLLVGAVAMWGAAGLRDAAELRGAAALWGIARRDAGLLLLVAVVANSASVLAGTILYGLIR